MLVYRSTIAAATVASSVLAGCTDPDLPTDLKKSGPPDVTTVTVMSDLNSSADPGLGVLERFEETATFCTVNKSFVSKRPGLVGTPDFRTFQICPDDPTMGAPDNGTAEGAPPSWFVRVVFDELLDPSVEDLMPQLDSMGVPTGITVATLKNTQPVVLKCNGVDVPYDGYYVPNGNRNAFPPGPSLFINPSSPTSVATGSSCTVSVKDVVHNKHGEPVPSDQRDGFAFKLAGMTLRFTSVGGTEVDLGDPAGTDGSVELDPTLPVDFYWTAAISTPLSLTPADIKISSGPNLANGDGDPAVCAPNGGTPLANPLVIHPFIRGTTATTTALIVRLDLKGVDTAATWDPDTTYRVTFGPNAKVTPKQGIAPNAPTGAPPSDFAICFHTTSGM
jgi:hypothetical protein